MTSLLPPGAGTLPRARPRSSAAAAFAQDPVAPDDGLIKVRSAYSMDETIARIRKDIAAKGIMFFQAVDQSDLAAKAGIALRPSTLLTFGNPPLGAQFLTSNPYSGLDWPVRLLVLQDEAGVVWAAYTDFAWIARRHRIGDRSRSSPWPPAWSSRSPRRSRPRRRCRCRRRGEARHNADKPCPPPTTPSSSAAARPGPSSPHGWPAPA